MEAKYKGIDVSKWQGDINWEKVRASGVEFAMLRAGFGRCQGQNDTSFERNYREAKKNDILVGAYHYSYAKTVSDAEKEAEYFLSLISGKSFEFPVAFDIEDNSQKNLSREEISNIVEAFCGKTDKAGYFLS
ncbi:MAG: glycoside hydrolase, partial [Ruminococcus sp.]|nr:glycoside hydrolase [Ruminococcus sp.]